MHFLFGNRELTSAGIHNCYWLLWAQAFHMFSDLGSRVHHVISAWKRGREKEGRHREKHWEREPCPKRNQGQGKIISVSSRSWRMECVWTHPAIANLLRTLWKMNRESESIHLYWDMLYLWGKRGKEEYCTPQKKLTVDYAPSAYSIIARFSL